MDQYFVVGPEEIIAQDLAHAIRAFDERAVVSVFRKGDDALAALSETRPYAVIVHGEPERFSNTGLGRALKAGRIPHAFLCALAGDQSTGAAILESPFNEATVAALLQNLLECAPATRVDA